MISIKFSYSHNGGRKVDKLAYKSDLFTSKRNLRQWEPSPK